MSKRPRSAAASAGVVSQAVVAPSSPRSANVCDENIDDALDAVPASNIS
jgi:hypothetical protein